VKKAVSLLEEVVKIREQSLAEDHPDRQAPQHAMARAYEANGQVKEAVSLLVEKDADLESKDRYGRTPLSWAAEKGLKAVVRLLLEKGADPESKDAKYGRTPLSWAAVNGHEAVMRLMLEKGADPESKDMHGRTPLSWAAERGHEAVVRLILEKGADPESKDAKYDRTPLSWAGGRDHPRAHPKDHPGSLRLTRQVTDESYYFSALCRPLSVTPVEAKFSQFQSKDTWSY
jgi:ankyrin repeat protein